MLCVHYVFTHIFAFIVVDISIVLVVRILDVMTTSGMALVIVICASCAPVSPSWSLLSLDSLCCDHTNCHLLSHLHQWYQHSSSLYLSVPVYIHSQVTLCYLHFQSITIISNLSSFILIFTLLSLTHTVISLRRFAAHLTSVCLQRPCSKQLLNCVKFTLYPYIPCIFILNQAHSPMPPT